jgi:membrane-bound metal-dependent hydrolase YbcI (DUF457 family)
MPLPLHLSIHIFLSLLAGFLVWRIWRKPWASFISALIAGVAVDFDHFIDYFLAFGLNFKPHYFLNGYQFLKSDKIYIIFHAWEYVIIFIVLAIIFRNKLAKAILFSLALGLFFHLSADSILNEGMKPQAYFLVYRTENNFDTGKLVTADHWQKQKQQKEITKFD